jgi:hypothetical protein
MISPFDPKKRTGDVFRSSLPSPGLPVVIPGRVDFAAVGPAISVKDTNADLSLTIGYGSSTPPSAAAMTTSMPDSATKWKERKAKFPRDLLPGEELFFPKKAREWVSEKGHPFSEDLFNYCCFLTLRERLRLIGSADGDGRDALHAGRVSQGDRERGEGAGAARG